MNPQLLTQWGTAIVFIVIITLALVALFSPKLRKRLGKKTWAALFSTAIIGLVGSVLQSPAEEDGGDDHGQGQAQGAESPSGGDVINVSVGMVNDDGVVIGKADEKVIINEKDENTDAEEK